MIQLMVKIQAGKYTPVPADYYSEQMRNLVESLLCYDKDKRPYMPTVMANPFVLEHVARVAEEFSKAPAEATIPDIPPRPVLKRNQQNMDAVSPAMVVNSPVIPLPLPHQQPQQQLQQPQQQQQQPLPNSHPEVSSVPQISPAAVKEDKADTKPMPPPPKIPLKPPSQAVPKVEEDIDPNNPIMIFRANLAKKEKETKPGVGNQPGVGKADQHPSSAVARTKPPDTSQAKEPTGGISSESQPLANIPTANPTQIPQSSQKAENASVVQNTEPNTPQPSNININISVAHEPINSSPQDENLQINPLYPPLQMPIVKEERTSMIMEQLRSVKSMVSFFPRGSQPAQGQSSQSSLHLNTSQPQMQSQPPPQLQLQLQPQLQPPTDPAIDLENARAQKVAEQIKRQIGNMPRRGSIVRPSMLPTNVCTENHEIDWLESNQLEGLEQEDRNVVINREEMDMRHFLKFIKRKFMNIFVADPDDDVNAPLPGYDNRSIRIAMDGNGRRLGSAEQGIRRQGSAEQGIRRFGSAEQGVRRQGSLEQAARRTTETPDRKRTGSAEPIIDRPIIIESYQPVVQPMRLTSPSPTPATAAQSHLLSPPLPQPLNIPASASPNLSPSVASSTEAAALQNPSSARSNANPPSARMETKSPAATERPLAKLIEDLPSKSSGPVSVAGAFANILDAPQNEPARLRYEFRASLGLGAQSPEKSARLNTSERVARRENALYQAHNPLDYRATQSCPPMDTAHIRRTPFGPVLLQSGNGGDADKSVPLRMSNTAPNIIASARTTPAIPSRHTASLVPTASPQKSLSNSPSTSHPSETPPDPPNPPESQLQSPSLVPAQSQGQSPSSNPDQKIPKPSENAAQSLQRAQLGPSTPTFLEPAFAPQDSLSSGTRSVPHAGPKIHVRRPIPGAPAVQAREQVHAISVADVAKMSAMMKENGGQVLDVDATKAPRIRGGLGVRDDQNESAGAFPGSSHRVHQNVRQGRQSVSPTTGRASSLSSK